MIPETSGTYAVMKDGTVPVIAWDAEGDAMVADGRGYLTSARHVPGFKWLDGPVDAATAPLALIPGGGWQAEFGDGCTSPVVAWGVGRDGEVRPYVPVDDVADTAGGVRGLDFTVIHRDGLDHTEGVDMT